MRKKISLILCVLLLASAAPAALAAEQSEALLAVRMVGIMVGDGNGSMSLEQNVTRAQFAKMLTIAAGLGEAAAAYAPFRDVAYTHWASGYIKTATDNGWFMGYIDGTFRPDNTILLEEAATAILRTLGYTESDYSGVYPQAQLAKYRNLELDTAMTAVQGQALTRSDCVTLFYNLLNAKNKEGQIQATLLGYSVDDDGIIDLDAMVLGEAKGPFVAEDTGWLENLPLDLDTVTIYLNDRLVDSVTPDVYDIYYYSAGGSGNTLWVYNEKAVGIYTEAAPSQTAPESVTVAGTAYTLGTADIKKKVTNQLHYGEAVALLMGREGKVIEVLPADRVDSLRYGVVLETGVQTHQVGTSGKISYTVTIAATDGKEYSYATDNEHVTKGALVSASYEDGSTVVTRLSSKSLTGKVNAAGTKLGSTDVAADACVLEVTEDGRYQTLYMSRLAGYTLTVGDVAFYATDAAGAVTHLILNDVTGDMHQYGILTSVTETETERQGEDGMSDYSYSGEYEYMLDGKASSYKMMDGFLNHGSATGPAMFTIEGTGISGIAMLKKVTIGSIGTATVQSADNQSFGLSDGVQVYLERNGEYYETQLSAVSAGDYTLTGYYDTGFSAGGRIRVIIAKVK